MEIIRLLILKLSAFFFSLYNLILRNMLMWQTLLLTDLLLLLFYVTLCCRATSAPDTDVASLKLQLCLVLLLHFMWIKMYTVFQKKWRQNSNHY